MLWKSLGYSLYLLLPLTIFLFPLMPVGVALICMGISYCLDRGESISSPRSLPISDARDAHIRMDGRI